MFDIYSRPLCAKVFRIFDRRKVNTKPEINDEKFKIDLFQERLFARDKVIVCPFNPDVEKQKDVLTFLCCFYLNIKIFFCILYHHYNYLTNKVIILIKAFQFKNIFLIFL